MTIREKIKARLDEVEVMMKGQKHLEDPEGVLEVLEGATKFWAVLSEDDKDFVHSVRYAIEDGVEWK